MNNLYEAEAGKLIKDFIDTDWSKDDESAGKAAQILKGLAFSDDPKAIEMKERITSSATVMGLPPNVDMNVILNNMGKLLESMREQIDKTGSDL